MAATLRELAIFGEVAAPAPPAEPTGHLVIDTTAIFGDVKVLRR